MGKKTNKEKRERRAAETVMVEQSRTIQRNTTIYYCILAGLFLLLLFEVFNIV
jgi:uncharacterized integral membrane protein